MIYYFEEPTQENQTFPCGICNKNISDNHQAAKCSICNSKIHIKCQNIDSATYEKNRNNYIFCLKCLEEIIPFQQLSDQQFYMTSEKGINKYVDLLNLSILPNNSLKTYFKDINNVNCPFSDNDDDAPAINCYYVVINSFNYKNKNGSLSLFHLNIASLSKNKDELETIINMIDLKFGVIGINETRIKTTNPRIGTNINGYFKCYSSPTEADKGGALLCIDEHNNTKQLPNIDKIMYKSKLLESVFIEIFIKNQKNIIVGCIYRHPSMDLN